MSLNTFGWAVLSFSVIRFLLELVAGLLNLRAMGRARLPADASPRDAANHARAIAYNRAGTHLGLIRSAVGLGLFLGFWGLGGFAWLDRVTQAWGWEAVPTGLAFLGLLFLAGRLGALPFAIWRTFVLEARFGFNRTSPATFLADRLKGGVLGLLLGGATLGILLWLFNAYGPKAWILCWVAVAAFTLLIQWVAPALIMPLFNRFEPLPDGPLRRALFDYARRVDFPLGQVSVMDGSRRSAKGNAFFTGFGRFRRIALFDTLLESCAIAEATAILAHEVGHWKKRHMARMTLLGVLHAGLFFYLLAWSLDQPGLFDAFGVENRTVHAGLLFFSLLFSGLDLILSPLMKGISRRHERQADRFAIETLDEPEALASGLRKLSRDHLANPAPHPFFVALNYSHPPLAARLAQMGPEVAQSMAEPARGR